MSARSRSDDDDRRSARGGRDENDRGQGGWFGDPEGHAEAARKGWRSREDDDDDRRGGSRSRSRDDDDDRRSSRGGRDDNGHGGWFGDSRGHAEAARRGWENRR